MYGRAYTLYFSQNTSEEAEGVFRSFGKKVRERFSRDSKPTTHLGGASPEDHGPPQFHLIPLDRERQMDLEYWPKNGTSLENVEIHIG